MRYACKKNMMNMVGSGIELCRDIVSFRVTSMDKHSFFVQIMLLSSVVNVYVFCWRFFPF